MVKLNDSNLCLNTKCDHFCSVRFDNTTECSCQNGYDLTADGHTCVGILIFIFFDIIFFLI